MKKIINNKIYISSNKVLMKEWDYQRNKGKDPTTYLIDSEEMVCWVCHKGHLWEDTIKNRVKGAKCFGCITRKVVAGFNDLKTLAPELASQWDYEKNKDLTPEQVTCCSNKKVWWKCKHNHSWISVISSRYYGSGCPYCTNRKVLTGFNDLETINPILAMQWDYEENGIITPSLILATSSRKVGWICPYGHKWSATVVSRHNGNGCPYCAGKIAIAGVNDLKSHSHKLSVDWDYKKNGKLKPENVTCQSHKKVWWLCPYGHSWSASIASRYNGNGCPVCNNKKVIKGVNDLLTINPELAYEWDEKRNGDLTPQDVTAGSNKVVGWKCSEGHGWFATINDRNSGRGCPICANKKILKGYNDLYTTNPKLAKEWNFKKNGKLRPTHISCHSNKKVWWKCSKGHEWRASVNDRSNGNGCPFCFKIKMADMYRKKKIEKEKRIIYKI